MDIPKYTPDFTHGCCIGMPNGTYHANKAVSLSKLKVFLNSRRHYEGQYLTGEHDRPESDALRKGSAQHAYTLEGGDAFNADFAVVGELGFKNGEEKWESIKRLNSILIEPLDHSALEPLQKFKKDDIIAFFVDMPGKSRVTQDEADTILSVDEAVKAHPIASQLLAAGYAEVSFRSLVSEKLGYAVQCRTDWFNPDGCTASDGLPYFADLKTVASLDRWDKAWYDFGYHLQWPFYREVQKVSCGKIVAERCYFIVAETQWPFRVIVRTPNEQDWDHDMMQVERGILGMAQAFKDKDFNDPHWDKTQVQSPLKPWQRHEIENAGEVLLLESPEQQSLEG